MATPATAPSSRLVLVIDAAIPEYSGGRLVSAVEVTGTTRMPKPIPARHIVEPTVVRPAVGVMKELVRKTPAAATRQPTIMGSRDPTAPTQRPVKSDAATMPPSNGKKSWANWYAPAEPTTTRYSATKK